jgi:hypothetical protein
MLSISLVFPNLTAIDIRADWLIVFNSASVAVSEMLM